MGKSGFQLTDEQKAAIRYRGGHLRIIACAGSGKTEAISRRVSTLIEEGVEPAQIVAFTFTERAAASLKVRITRRIAESKGQSFLDQLSPMFIGTIHAYCLHMLQDHVPEFGNFDLLDENKLAGLLSREHKRLKLSELGPQHWQPIFDFLRNADVIENELLDPQQIKDTLFGKCYLDFEKILFRYHFLTYGLLVSESVKALSRPDVFEKVHGSLRHLIVDEYQDINPAQEKLISLLAKSPVHLCVVGDDDQAIYQWRGSDVSNMLEITKRYKRTTSLTLSTNLRSRPMIIATANGFAKSISPRLPKKMKPHQPTSGPEVHSWAAETVPEEAEVIADTIERLLKKGYRYKDIAILFRSVRTSSPPFIEIFQKRGIPFRCAGRTGLFLQPEASVLGKTYAWLLGNDWKNDRYGGSEPVDLNGLLTEFQDVFNGGKTVIGLTQYLNEWKTVIGDDATPANLVRDLYRLLNLLGIQNLELDDALASARMGCLARFSQILADFEHIKRRGRYDEEGVFRGGQDRGIWFYRQFFNYLQYYALEAYEDFEGEDTFDIDTVDILTVHQAKGLEWPVVFLPALVKGRFPSGKAGEPQQWLIPSSVFDAKARSRYEGGEAEERRLFYVALTRAKDILYLSRFRKMKNRFQPSPFLLAVTGGDPDVADKLPLPEPFVPPPDEADELPTFSFSELASYEDCPLRFRLSSSLSFQSQLATELGYGKAIHHILRRVADLAKAKKKLPTAVDVEKVFEEAFYLPFASKSAFEQMFNRARALVDKYLAEYSSDLMRVWETERPFELHLEKGIVSGRADVILDMEGGKINSLALVDYKTANDQKTDDVFAFQLAVYAAAARGEGIDVSAAYIHQLKAAERRNVPIGDETVEKSKKRADLLIDGIVQGKFPARPEASKCGKCDVRTICKHAKGKHDFRLAS